MAAGQLGGFRAGDWACPLCSNHNYASKIACNRCGAPKVGAKGGGGKGAGGPGGYGKNSPASYGGGGEGKGGGNALSMRPGDWCCPQCYNHNYADKMACFRCGVPKIPHMHGPPVGFSPMGGMKGGWFGGAGEKRQGDWKCYGCGNNNYASRTEACNRCNLPKSVFVSKSGMRPGDWVCPTCQNHNWADRSFCLKCQTPKAGSQVHTKGMRPGDWLCIQCSNHNYASKDRCNKCQRPKQAGSLTMPPAS